MLFGLACQDNGAANNLEDDSDVVKDTVPVSFASSPCKMINTPAPKKAFHLHTVEGSDDLNGFNCISWKTTEEKLQVDFINFPANCGGFDTATSRMEENELVFTVQNSYCQEASCGSCNYDWSLSGELPPSTDFDIRVETEICPGGTHEPDMYDFSASVTNATVDSGLQCQYQSYPFGISFACGALNSPCNAPEGASMKDLQNFECDPSPTQCAENLECVRTEEMPTSLCVATCSEDGDCPLPHILSCNEGHCLL